MSLPNESVRASRKYPGRLACDELKSIRGSRPNQLQWGPTL